MIVVTRIDAPDSTLQHELIRDIGKHWGEDTLTREQQLMQRSGDPLLVREFLLHQATPGYTPTFGPPKSGAELVLIPGVSLGGGVERPNLPETSKRYADRSSLLESSVRPCAFEPSVQEREGAMELELSTRHSTPPSTSLSGMGAAAGGAALIVALLWLSLALVLD
jgi:hypothetical protein